MFKENQKLIWNDIKNNKKINAKFREYYGKNCSLIYLYTKDWKSYGSKLVNNTDLEIIGGLMKGFIGTQKGEKRGTYNTSGTKQIKIKIDVCERLEKVEGKSFSEKITNILNKINEKG